MGARLANSGGKSKTALGAIARRRLIEHLELLCDSGAGIAGIAAPACAIARQLVDGDQAAMFWLDADGNPAGFFHETNRVDLKDMFVTRFAELFDGPGQENMLTLTETEGPAIGRCLPQTYLDRFWTGNIYKYLCVPLDHHYMIDVRVESAGRGRAVLLIWHRGQRLFTADDVKTLYPIKRMLDRAAANTEMAGGQIARGSGNAHLITDIEGQRLVAIDAEAEAMLMASHLLSQNIAMANVPRAAPAFAGALAALHATGLPARFAADAANGRIIAEAHLTRMFDAGLGEVEMLYIALVHLVSAAVPIIAWLIEQPLSPVQRRLALAGLMGQERVPAGEQLGIGATALKTHAKRIHEVLHVARWADLAAKGAQLARS